MEHGCKDATAWCTKAIYAATGQVKAKARRKECWSSLSLRNDCIARRAGHRLIFKFILQGNLQIDQLLDMYTVRISYSVFYPA